MDSGGTEKDKNMSTSFEYRGKIYTASGWLDSVDQPLIVLRDDGTPIKVVYYDACGNRLAVGPGLARAAERALETSGDRGRR